MEEERKKKMGNGKKNGRRKWVMEGERKKKMGNGRRMEEENG